MSNILSDALKDQPLICAEGYLFEMERRGYLTSGEFVPEVALEHPEVLENLHKEFQHAGSNIVQAFTYNGHREKMRVIDKEHLLEPLNRAALRIARKCADNPPKGLGVSLMAGNISNSNIWEADNKSTGWLLSLHRTQCRQSTGINDRRIRRPQRQYAQPDAPGT